MKKIEKRAVMCLILAGVLLAGLAVFCFKFVVYGGKWAGFPSNSHLYSNGVLVQGTVLDRNGTVLSQGANGVRTYHDSERIRRATLHAVGDPGGKIGSGALTQFAGKLTGYNFINGAYSMTEKGQKLYLTLDADLCATAYRALDGRNGTVGVYNYRTGEILCMVSTPTFDPLNPPETPAEGSYVNKLLSGTVVPGSIFKLVTTAAAIDNLPDLFEREFTCTGSLVVGDSTITCPKAHGTLSVQDALAVSCNCTYAQLTEELGTETMKKTVDQLGLTKSLSVDGINTAKGSFSFTEGASLAWAGIGQGEDLLNPCTMLTYMGAIANGGQPVLPRILSKVTTAGGIQTEFHFQKSGSRMLSADTAAKLTEMMHYDVVHIYGEGNYPGLDLCAKSGTAEVGAGLTPNAWFSGFIRNEEHPLAFIVLVENGGSGSSVAGSVANKVLQAAIAK